MGLTRESASEPRSWLVGRTGLRLAAFWGFSEGTLFFLLPDIVFTASALYSIRASLRQMLAAVLGSVVGGALLFSFAAHDPAAARSLVAKVPLIGPRMFDQVQKDFRASPVWAPRKGPPSGIPYKVYAVEAPAFTSLPVFLLVTVPVRLERFMATWGLFALLGFLFRHRIQRHPRAALLFHAGFWFAVYGYYWSVI